MPELTGAHALSDDWRLTSKFSSMNTLFDGESDIAWKPTHLQSDVQLFLGYRLHPEWEVAAGYHFLIIGDAPAHRFIQQLSKVSDLTRLRIGHRWRTDQTYASAQAPRYRTRYRLSIEVPLSGFELDPTEFYFLASSEPMGSLRSGQFDLEHRLGISIGRVLAWRKTKVELGLDYRTRSILSGLDHRFLLRWGWFLKL